MALDIELQRFRWISYDKGKSWKEDKEIVYETSIFHTFREIAEKANLYNVCWRPYKLHLYCPKKFTSNDQESCFENVHTMLAKNLIEPLEKGYIDLTSNPEKFNTVNGQEHYIDFMIWVKNYLEACKKFPDAEVYVYR